MSLFLFLSFTTGRKSNRCSLPHVSIMMYCFTTGPKVTGLRDHVLKPKNQNQPFLLLSKLSQVF